MGLPEYRPMDRHITTDTSDTDAAWGVFGLIGAALLLVFAVLLLLAVITGIAR